YRDINGLNPTCSVVLIPHPNPEMGTIVWFFGIDRAQQKLLDPVLKTLGAKDYHYQNSTDRERGISAKDWKEREKSWDKITELSGVPREIGFSLDLISKERAIRILFQELSRAHPPKGGWQPD